MDKKLGKDYRLEVQQLNESNKHYLKGFACGNESIDLYFQGIAATDNTSVTYIFIDKDADRLFACATVVCSAVFFEQECAVFSSIIHSMEIKFFAVDENYRHIKYEEGSSLTLSMYVLRYVLSLLYDI